MTSSKGSSFHSRAAEDFDRPVPLPPRGAAQSRFIPREELDGFASWRPGLHRGSVRGVLGFAGDAFARRRRLLLWLFQDLVWWLLHTQQIESFRPRRN